MKYVFYLAALVSVIQLIALITGNYTPSKIDSGIDNACLAILFLAAGIGQEAK